jgi:hypothetical protein
VSDYPAPVDKLLTLGDRDAARAGWPDYVRLYGLTAEHVPDLIRMATDSALNLGDPESKEVWAPVHAWRALGQLRATAAVRPLLELLVSFEDEYDDAAQEELPPVFALIGPAAIPELAAYLADRSNGFSARGAFASGLVEIAKAHPEARAECVRILTEQLAQARADEPDLNGWVVADLLDLKAVEAAPVIEKAFAAGAVDPTIAGDWLWVQWELGLSNKPPPRGHRFGNDPLLTDLFRPVPSPGRKVKDKAKAKRKQAAKSRKRNRKRK